MPINPVTLDKKEPLVIRQIEQKVVDRIVHEARGAEINKEQDGQKQGFTRQKQESEAQKLSQYLSSFKLKLDYRVGRNRIRVKIIDRQGNLLVDTEVEDIERLHSAIRKETGAIIDMKG